MFENIGSYSILKSSTRHYYYNVIIYCMHFIFIHIKARLKPCKSIIPEYRENNSPLRRELYISKYITTTNVIPFVKVQE